MRCLVILALAVLFAAVAQAYVSQADARILSDRWKNCSQVINGRLGALHPVTLLDEDTSVFVMQDTKWGYAVTYSPCLLHRDADNTDSWYLLQIQDTYSNMVKENGLGGQYVATAFPKVADYMPDGVSAEVVTFNMPSTKGDVPKFIGQYTAVGDKTRTATVTTLCNPGVNSTGVLQSVNVTTKKDGATHFDIVFLTHEACARFPYTNEAMPAGGVAALIVVIIAFVLQFSVCAWYHKTHKIETPFTTGEEPLE